jgi:hypothetical protein
MIEKVKIEDVVPGHWYDASKFQPPGFPVNPDNVSINVLTAVYNMDGDVWDYAIASLWYNKTRSGDNPFWNRHDGRHNIKFWQVPIEPPANWK